MDWKNAARFARHTWRGPLRRPLWYIITIRNHPQPPLVHTQCSKGNKHYLQATCTFQTTSTALLFTTIGRQAQRCLLVPGITPPPGLHRPRIPLAVLDYVTDMEAGSPTQNYTHHMCRASWQCGRLTAIPRATPWDPSSIVCEVAQARESGWGPL